MKKTKKRKRKKKNYCTLFNDVDPWLKHENNVHRIFITTIYMTCSLDFPFTELLF